MRIDGPGDLKWLPLNPTKYSRQGNSIVSLTVGMTERYDDCAISDMDNWSCSYGDGSGSFGFMNGGFYEYPVTTDQYFFVSRWAYNKERCGWHQYDYGPFWGLVSCWPCPARC
jgi:hypothetical protein